MLRPLTLDTFIHNIVKTQFLNHAKTVETDNFKEPETIITMRKINITIYLT